MDCGRASGRWTNRRSALKRANYTENLPTPGYFPGATVLFHGDVAERSAFGRADDSMTVSSAKLFWAASVDYFPPSCYLGKRYNPPALRHVRTGSWRHPVSRQIGCLPAFVHKKAMNIRVYIDGFNLYYGALKNRPEYKWLDLVKLSQKTAWEFFPQNDCNIDLVRYFTSLVKGRLRNRQKKYIRALKFLPTNQDKIEIHYGSFRYRPFTAKLVNIPIANNNIVRVDDEGGCLDENIRLVTGDYEVNSRILPVRLRLEDEGFANAPKALSVKASKPEEKRTDVNIACHLLNDA